MNEATLHKNMNKMIPMMLGWNLLSFSNSSMKLGVSAISGIWNRKMVFFCPISDVELHTSSLRTGLVTVMAKPDISFLIDLFWSTIRSIVVLQQSAMLRKNRMTTTRNNAPNFMVYHKKMGIPYKAYTKVKILPSVVTGTMSP